VDPDPVPSVQGQPNDPPARGGTRIASRKLENYPLDRSQMMPDHEIDLWRVRMGTAGLPPKTTGMLAPVQRGFGPLLLLASLMSFAVVRDVTVAQPSQGDSPPRPANAHALHDDLNVQTAGRSANNFERVDGIPADSTQQQPGAPFDQTVHYFYEPFPMEPGSSVFQIGASFSLLPVPDAEQELPIPALDIQYKRAIIDHLAVIGSLSTCIYSNLIHAGIQWNTGLDRFSVGLAGHIGLAYGFITKENVFDHVQGYGLFDMLILRLGYRFDDFSFSCAFVATYVMKSKSYVNGLEASVGPQRTVNDYYCTLAVEQPFLRNLRLSIGFSLGYARTPYQTWMFYNTIDEWLFTPEFFFAVQL
jgi:hypothetical protein